MCDQAFQQAITGKWCLIGVFDTMHAPALPFAAQPFVTFVSLSDFAGDVTVMLTIRDEEGAVVKAVRGKIPRTPMGLFQYVFPFTDIEFAKPGVHTLELHSGDQLIALRSFRVQSGEVDPEQEEAEALALDTEHRDHLIKEAREVWSQHPEAQPVGLLVSAEATATPWFRHAFETVFGTTPPQATFVGIVDPETLTRLLGGQGFQVEDALNPPIEHDGRMLTVAIVTKGGFKFGYHALDEE
jgi:Family of unknown function (DUF6941)